MNLIVYYEKNKDILNIVSKFKNDYSADTYEIQTLNSVGFIDKLKNNRLPIKRCNLNLLNYENVILITSLWHNVVPSPVIRFLEQSTGRIKKITYVLYNGNKEDKPREFEKMDKILNLRRDKSYFVSLNKKEITVRVYQ